jgi:1,4-alpha-glucan branching enzyme
MAKARGMTKIQTFSLTDRNATSVMLVGDFTQWQKNPIPLKRGDDGVWSTIIALGPGTHRYRFLVDGEWRDDPECILRVQNPYGSEDSVRQVQ